MAPRQRERKMNPQTPERTADASTHAAQRIVDHLKELGPESRAFEPSRIASPAQPDMSAQEKKRDKLVAQLGKEPESAASTPASVPALDLEQIKAQGRDAAKRWAQELAQQKARELERQREMERQRELERSQSRGRGLGRGPGREGPDYDLEM